MHEEHTFGVRSTLVVFVPFAVIYMRQPVRLDFLWASLCILGAPFGGVAAAQGASGVPGRDVVYEASISDLQTLMSSGRATSVQLVDAYFARIAAYDHAGPRLNAM